MAGIARLHPGSRVTQLQAEIEAISARLQSVFPDSNQGWTGKARWHAACRPCELCMWTRSTRCARNELFRLRSRLPFEIFLAVCFGGINRPNAIGVAAVF